MHITINNYNFNSSESVILLKMNIVTGIFRDFKCNIHGIHFERKIYQTLSLSNAFERTLGEPSSI